MFFFASNQGSVGRDESSWDGPRPSSSSGRDEDEINFKLWGREQDNDEMKTRQGRLEDEMRMRIGNIRPSF